MCPARAIADEVKAFEASRAQVLVYVYGVVVEFTFNAVNQVVVVYHTGNKVVECLNHFDNVVQNAFRKHKAQITGFGIKGW